MKKVANGKSAAAKTKPTADAEEEDDDDDEEDGESEEVCTIIHFKYLFISFPVLELSW